MTPEADLLESLTADELAIARVIVRYGHGIDSLDMRVVASCYFDDATEDRGRFVGSLAEFLPWLEAELRKLESCWHLLGYPRIELEGDAAGVETYCLAIHRTRPTAERAGSELLIPCRYRDRFERRAGEWRIARRTAIYEPTIMPAAAA
jgi:SnoaL-like domain